MPRYLTYLTYVVLSTGLLTACPGPHTNVPPPTAESAGPDPRQVAYRAAWETRDWLLVACGADEATESRLYDFVKEIASHQPDGRRFLPRRGSEIEETELANRAVILVGNQFPDLAWRGVGSEAPRSFRGYDLTQTNHWLRVFAARNPWSSPDTATTLHLFYAPDADFLAERLRTTYAPDGWNGLFRPRYGYQLDAGSEPRLRGFFARQNWLPDPERELTFSPVGKPIYADDLVALYAPDGRPAPSVVEQIARRVRTDQLWVGDLAGIKSMPPLQLYLYPDLERITLRRNIMNELQYAAEENTFHLSWAQWERELRRADWFYGLLRWVRTHPLAHRAPNDAFWDRGLAVLLANRGVPNLPGHLPKPEQLQRRERPEFGDYLYDLSVAASLASETGIATSLVRNWNDTLLKPVDPQRRISWPDQFQKGMTLAHEGYQVVNGYGGGTVGPSLDSLSRLGVNAISVVPYTYQPDPHQVPDLPVMESTGTENNAAVRAAVREAHARGWSVLLKPQIWVGKGSWPGDIDLADDLEWGRWFRRYEEWILNYALLAAEEGVAGLCMGTELRYATLKHPDRWRALIGRVRKVYSGYLTYAANWGEEFEQLAFGDALDALGLNAYYPLTKTPEPTDAELLAGATRWVKLAETKARQVGKPWLLTEVGFRSVDRCWLNPHAGPEDRPLNLDDQARSYLALTTALGEAKQLRGVYVWKWPSFLGRRSGRNGEATGFTPGGKPAAAILSAFYATHP